MLKEVYLDTPTARVHNQSQQCLERNQGCIHLWEDWETDETPRLAWLWPQPKWLVFGRLPAIARFCRNCHSRGGLYPANRILGLCLTRSQSRRGFQESLNYQGLPTKVNACTANPVNPNSASSLPNAVRQALNTMSSTGGLFNPNSRNWSNRSLVFQK